MHALLGRRNTVIENRRKSIAPFVSFTPREVEEEEDEHQEIPENLIALTPERTSVSSSRSHSSSASSAPKLAGHHVQETQPVRRIHSIEEESMPTGQHNIAHYNIALRDAPNNLHGMSEGLSADIIRNSLNAFVNIDQNQVDNNPNIPSGPTSSNSSNTYQVEAQVHSTDNSGSSTASSVSSNIDFNFEPFEDDFSNENENDFPLTTFQPTRISQKENQEIPWNIPLGQTQESPKTGRLSTRF
jgi:hypothetical protein